MPDTWKGGPLRRLAFPLTGKDVTPAISRLSQYFSPLLVAATLYISTAILIESSLSYLGLGVQPPDPTWGSIINEGREVLRIALWISTFAGLVIMVSILSFNILDDTLRDFLDPRLRRQI